MAVVGNLGLTLSLLSATVDWLASLRYHQSNDTTDSRQAPTGGRIESHSLGPRMVAISAQVRYRSSPGTGSHLKFMNLGSSSS